MASFPSATWNHSTTTRPQDGPNTIIATTTPLLVLLSSTNKWLYYIGLPLILAFLWGLWDYFLKLQLLRKWYERQGISFLDSCYAVVGAEMRVTKLQETNRTHDWLYLDTPNSLYGTFRGLNLQLYTTSSQLCSQLLEKTGKQIDRNSPAIHSVGRLSPTAIPFQSMHYPRFKDRKASLTRALRDNKRLFDIIARNANEALDKFVAVTDGSGGTARIDAQELLEHWTRFTSGEYVWGRDNIDRDVTVEDADGAVRTLPFMVVLNKTFTELRFYSNKFWNRVCIPLARLPLTHEARRLTRNVNLLRGICRDMLHRPEEGTVAALVSEMHHAGRGKDAMPEGYTLDDLVTATFAGLDAVKSAVMGCVYHLLNPENERWRKAILEEMNNLDDEVAGAGGGNGIESRVMQAPILNSFMWESLRFEPPGSLINNAAVADFELRDDKGQTYKIKAGTRIVSNIHALHQHDASWQALIGRDGEMSPLNVFDPERFLKYGDKLIGSASFMPFGRGPRRCPGQAAGMLMVKTFLKVFVQRDFKDCRAEHPNTQTKESSRFHVYSKATYDILFENEDKLLEEQRQVEAQ